MQINCQSNGSIFISQEAYINQILRKFNMVEAKNVLTPFSREESDNHKDVSGKAPNRESVGSLKYLAVATRPDIALVVSKAARVMDRPAEKDWNNTKRIFHYLRSTRNYGRRYNRGSGDLKVFSDTDFAGDKATRHSTMGVIAIFAEGAVSWTSQLQRRQPSRQLNPRLLQQVKGPKN